MIKIDYAKFDSYLETHMDVRFTELSREVAQPYVGAQNMGILDCDALVTGMLRQRGLATKVMTTG